MLITDGDHAFADRTFTDDVGEPLLEVRGGTLTMRRCVIGPSANRGLVVTNARVDLEACRFVGCSMAMWASGGAEVNLRRCHFEGPGSVALSFRTAAHGRVEDCTVSGYSDAAVTLRSGATPIFARCALSAHSIAIYVRDGGRGEFQGCTLTNMLYGVYVEATGAPTCVDCRIEGARGYGIGGRGGGRFERCNLDGNNVGVYLEAGADPDVIDCAIAGGSSCGIMTLDGALGRVRGCRIGPHPAGAMSIQSGARTTVL